jgi:hypothetical protein
VVGCRRGLFLGLMQEGPVFWQAGRGANRFAIGCALSLLVGPTDRELPECRLEVTRGALFRVPHARYYLVGVILRVGVMWRARESGLA